MSEYLPEELERRTISTLPDGHTGYCVSWAIYPEENNLSWIRGDMDVLDSPQGTTKVKIRREGEVIIAAKETVDFSTIDIKGRPPDEFDPIPLRWE